MAMAAERSYCSRLSLCTVCLSHRLVMLRRFLTAGAAQARRVMSPRTVGVAAGVAALSVFVAARPQNTSIVHAAAASTAAEVKAADEEAPSDYLVNVDLHTLLPDRPPNLTIRGLLFVTRHGSRTPMSLLPGQSREAYQALWGNCPLGDHSTIPCARGLLTHFGEFQLASVGWHMRHRYVHSDHFFPTSFDPAFFRFRSTDLPRTQLSLARMVQGLYPGLALDSFAPLIEVRQQKDETMYPNHYHCPRLKELYIEACHATRQNDPVAYPAAARYKAIAETLEALALREQFSAALKTPPDQLGTWVVIGDELKCRQSVGMPQVEGVTQKMADDANVLAEKTFWHIMREWTTTERKSKSR
jgi:hypothetical protein